MFKNVDRSRIEKLVPKIFENIIKDIPINDVEPYMTIKEKEEASKPIRQKLLKTSEKFRSLGNQFISIVGEDEIRDAFKPDSEHYETDRNTLKQALVDAFSKAYSWLDEKIKVKPEINPLKSNGDKKTPEEIKKEDELNIESLKNGKQPEDTKNTAGIKDVEVGEDLKKAAYFLDVAQEYLKDQWKTLNNFTTRAQNAYQNLYQDLNKEEYLNILSDWQKGSTKDKNTAEGIYLKAIEDFHRSIDWDNLKNLLESYSKNSISNFTDVETKVSPAFSKAVDFFIISMLEYSLEYEEEMDPSKKEKINSTIKYLKNGINSNKDLGTDTSGLPGLEELLSEEQITLLKGFNRSLEKINPSSKAIQLFRSMGTAIDKIEDPLSATSGSSRTDAFDNGFKYLGMKIQKEMKNVSGFINEFKKEYLEKSNNAIKSIKTQVESSEQKEQPESIKTEEGGKKKVFGNIDIDFITDTIESAFEGPSAKSYLQYKTQTVTDSGMSPVGDLLRKIKNTLDKKFKDGWRESIDIDSSFQAIDESSKDVKDKLSELFDSANELSFIGTDLAKGLTEEDNQTLKDFISLLIREVKGSLLRDDRDSFTSDNSDDKRKEKAKEIVGNELKKYLDKSPSTELANSLKFTVANFEDAIDKISETRKNLYVAVNSLMATLAGVTKYVPKDLPNLEVLRRELKSIHTNVFRNKMLGMQKRAAEENSAKMSTLWMDAPIRNLKNKLVHLVSDEDGSADKLVSDLKESPVYSAVERYSSLVNPTFDLGSYVINEVGGKEVQKYFDKFDTLLSTVKPLSVSPTDTMSPIVKSLYSEEDGIRARLQKYINDKMLPSIVIKEENKPKTATDVIKCAALVVTKGNNSSAISLMKKIAVGMGEGISLDDEEEEKTNKQEKNEPLGIMPSSDKETKIDKSYFKAASTIKTLATKTSNLLNKLYFVVDTLVTDMVSKESLDFKDVQSLASVIEDIEITLINNSAVKSLSESSPLRLVQDSFESLSSSELLDREDTSDLSEEEEKTNSSKNDKALILDVIKQSNILYHMIPSLFKREGGNMVQNVFENLSTSKNNKNTFVPELQKKDVEKQIQEPFKNIASDYKEIAKKVYSKFPDLKETDTSEKPSSIIKNKVDGAARKMLLANIDSIKNKLSPDLSKSLENAADSKDVLSSLVYIYDKVEKKVRPFINNVMATTEEKKSNDSSIVVKDVLDLSTKGLNSLSTDQKKSLKEYLTVLGFLLKWPDRSVSVYFNHLVDSKIGSVSHRVLKNTLARYSNEQGSVPLDDMLREEIGGIANLNEQAEASDLVRKINEDQKKIPTETSLNKFDKEVNISISSETNNGEKELTDAGKDRIMSKVDDLMSKYDIDDKKHSFNNEDKKYLDIAKKVISTLTSYNKHTGKSVEDVIAETLLNNNEKSDAMGKVKNAIKYIAANSGPKKYMEVSRFLNSRKFNEKDAKFPISDIDTGSSGDLASAVSSFVKGATKRSLEKSETQKGTFTSPLDTEKDVSSWRNQHIKQIKNGIASSLKEERDYKDKIDSLRSQLKGVINSGAGQSDEAVSLRSALSSNSANLDRIQRELQRYTSMLSAVSENKNEDSEDFAKNLEEKRSVILNKIKSNLENFEKSKSENGEGDESILRENDVLSEKAESLLNNITDLRGDKANGIPPRITSELSKRIENFKRKKNEKEKTFYNALRAARTLYSDPAVQDSSMEGHAEKAAQLDRLITEFDIDPEKYMTGLEKLNDLSKKNPEASKEARKAYDLKMNMLKKKRSNSYDGDESTEKKQFDIAIKNLRESLSKEDYDNLITDGKLFSDLDTFDEIESNVEHMVPLDGRGDPGISTLKGDYSGTTQVGVSNIMNNVGKTAMLEWFNKLKQSGRVDFEGEVGDFEKFLEDKKKEFLKIISEEYSVDNISGKDVNGVHIKGLIENLSDEKKELEKYVRNNNNLIEKVFKDFHSLLNKTMPIVVESEKERENLLDNLNSIAKSFNDTVNGKNDTDQLESSETTEERRNVSTNLKPEHISTFMNSKKILDMNNKDFKDLLFGKKTKGGEKLIGLKGKIDQVKKDSSAPVSSNYFSPEEKAILGKSGVQALMSGDKDLINSFLVETKDFFDNSGTDKIIEELESKTKKIIENIGNKETLASIDPISEEERNILGEDISSYLDDILDGKEFSSDERNSIKKELDERLEEKSERESGRFIGSSKKSKSKVAEEFLKEFKNLSKKFTEEKKKAKAITFGQAVTQSQKRNEQEDILKREKEETKNLLDKAKHTLRKEYGIDLGDIKKPQDMKNSLKSLYEGKRKVPKNLIDEMGNALKELSEQKEWLESYSEFSEKPYNQMTEEEQKKEDEYEEKYKKVEKNIDNLTQKVLSLKKEFSQYDDPDAEALVESIPALNNKMDLSKVYDLIGARIKANKLVGESGDKKRKNIDEAIIAKLNHPKSNKLLNVLDESEGALKKRIEDLDVNTLEALKDLGTVSLEGKEEELGTNFEETTKNLLSEKSKRLGLLLNAINRNQASEDGKNEFVSLYQWFVSVAPYLFDDYGNNHINSILEEANKTYHAVSGNIGSSFSPSKFPINSFKDLLSLAKEYNNTYSEGNAYTNSVKQYFTKQLNNLLDSFNEVDIDSLTEDEISENSKGIKGLLNNEYTDLLSSVELARIKDLKNKLYVTGNTQKTKRANDSINEMEGIIEDVNKNFNTSEIGDEKLSSSDDTNSFDDHRSDLALMKVEGMLSNLPENYSKNELISNYNRLKELRNKNITCNISKLFTLANEISTKKEYLDLINKINDAIRILSLKDNIKDIAIPSNAITENDTVYNDILEAVKGLLKFVSSSVNQKIYKSEEPKEKQAAAPTSDNATLFKKESPESRVVSKGNDNDSDQDDYSEFLGHEKHKDLDEFLRTFDKGFKGTMNSFDKYILKNVGKGRTFKKTQDVQRKNTPEEQNKDEQTSDKAQKLFNAVLEHTKKTMGTSKKTDTPYNKDEVGTLANALAAKHYVEEEERNSPFGMLPKSTKDKADAASGKWKVVKSEIESKINAAKEKSKSRDDKLIAEGKSMSDLSDDMREAIKKEDDEVTNMQNLLDQADNAFSKKFLSKDLEALVSLKKSMIQMENFMEDIAIDLSSSKDDWDDESPYTGEHSKKKLLEYLNKAYEYVTNTLRRVTNMNDAAKNQIISINDRLRETQREAVDAKNRGSSGSETTLSEEKLNHWVSLYVRYIAKWIMEIWERNKFGMASIFNASPEHLDKFIEVNQKLLGPVNSLGASKAIMNTQNLLKDSEAYHTPRQHRTNEQNRMIQRLLQKRRDLFLEKYSMSHLDVIMNGLKNFIRNNKLEGSGIENSKEYTTLATNVRKENEAIEAEASQVESEITSPKIYEVLGVDRNAAMIRKSFLRPKRASLVEKVLKMYKSL